MTRAANARLAPNAPTAGLPKGQGKAPAVWQLSVQSHHNPEDVERYAVQPSRPTGFGAIKWALTDARPPP